MSQQVLDGNLVKKKNLKIGQSNFTKNFFKSISKAFNLKLVGTVPWQWFQNLDDLTFLIANDDKSLHQGPTESLSMLPPGRILPSSPA